MKFTLLISTILLIVFSSASAQQKTTPPPEQKSGVQDVVRMVPELLPQAIRDSINQHPVTKDAEITSADQMSKGGNLFYKVNFLKGDESWSKTFDVNGRHVDDGRKEE